MSSERLLLGILSLPDEPLHLSGPPLLQVMTSWAMIWAVAMPAESASSSAPTSMTFMVLLISSPSRTGWGSRAPPLHEGRIIREGEGLCTLHLAGSRCCGVASVLLQAGRCPVEAGGPPLYRRPPHRVGDLQVHGRVEGGWDELPPGGKGGED